MLENYLKCFVSSTIEPGRSNEKCSIDIDTMDRKRGARAADALSFDRASLIERGRGSSPRARPVIKLNGTRKTSERERESEEAT